MLNHFLVTWFEATPAITSIIGNMPLRMYETASPKTEVVRARVVFFLVSSPVGRSLSTRDAKRYSRWQFDCYGRSTDEANALANAIESTVDPSTGPGSLYPKTIDARIVYSAQVVDRRGGSDVDAGPQRPQPCVQLDIMFCHNWP